MPNAKDIQLKICGDAKCIVDWANGLSAVNDKRHLANVHMTRNAFAQRWGIYNVLPVPAGGEWVQHQYRQFNDLADQLATKAIKEQSSKWVQKPIPKETVALQASFDGGLRKRKAATG